MFRWQATIGLVGSFVIIEPQPLRGIVLNFFNSVELILAQPGIAHRPIVALHIRILLRIARLGKFKIDTVLVRPLLERMADELWPVIAS